MIIPGQENADIVEGYKQTDRAFTENRRANRNQSVQPYTFDLSVERLATDPKLVDFAFKSVMIVNATDPSTTVYMRPTTRDEMQGFFPLSNRDSWTVEFPIPRAFFHWPSQPGKSITLIFFTDAEFRSGSQQSVSSGGVSINEGSTVSAPAVATLVAATAGIILAQNYSREVTTIQNDTGGTIFIGGSSTVTDSGSTKGVEVPAGAKIRWKNTAALWAYSPGGGSLPYLEET